MPSLIRFLTVLGVIAGLGFGGLYALATFVTPRTRQMSVTIPADRLRPPSAEAKAEDGAAVGARAAAANASETR